MVCIVYYDCGISLCHQITKPQNEVGVPRQQGCGENGHGWQPCAIETAMRITIATKTERRAVRPQWFVLDIRVSLIPSFQSFQS
jgi:hypothetical protein